MRHFKEMPAGSCTRAEFDEMVLKVVSAGRYGQPEDVTGMVLFLASERAGFISGALIDIAGGMQGQIAYYPTLKREFNAAMQARVAAAAAEQARHGPERQGLGGDRGVLGHRRGHRAGPERRRRPTGDHRAPGRAAAHPGRRPARPSATLAAAIEDPATPQALPDLERARFGRADALISNAGIFVAGTVDSAKPDDLVQMSRVNFDALVRSAYVFGRYFKAQRAGAILHVSSVAAYLSSSSAGVYSGLKHALEVVATALRVELAPCGVRVGLIAPGTTETEIFDKLRGQGQAVRADQTAPLAPDDVARAVRFMLEQPDRANLARLLLVSSAESA